MRQVRRLMALAALVAAPALAQTPGVTSTEIKIGNLNPYSGPASAYGTIGKSIGAYFKMINDQGGINGRKINYISYDDSYSPPKTVEMARKLVEQDQVALIFQPLGTAANSSIHKYMNQMKVPQLFVATGASKWNDPKNFPWTMGWQPNYQTEGQIYARYTLSNVKDAKIGILYQNDDYGKDYLKGFEDGLGDKKSLIVMKQSYEVTDPTVDSQIVNLKNSGANVFFNITIPKFAAQAIKKANDPLSATAGGSPPPAVALNRSFVLGSRYFRIASTMSPKIAQRSPSNLASCSCSMGAKSVGLVFTLMPGRSKGSSTFFRLAAWRMMFSRERSLPHCLRTCVIRIATL